MIEVRLATAVPASTFEQVPGVQEVVAFGERTRITVAGSIDPLVKALRATKSSICRAVNPASRRSS